MSVSSGRGEDEKNAGSASFYLDLSVQRTDFKCFGLELFKLDTESSRPKLVNHTSACRLVHDCSTVKFRAVKAEMKS